ncbi:zinc-dependent dehydrogenase [Candidatus Aerophobetes bacterium]|nr:zinc-dependent dehydrogenase [Candidatus Aerophobetes bacterium]
MKAAVYYGPGKIKIEERPLPEPAKGEVLLEVKACAICGTDVRIYSFGQKNVKPPHIIGHEISGIIKKIGGGVKGYKEGERVVLVTSVGCGRCEFCLQGRPNICPEVKAIGYFYSGGFTEYMIVPEEAVSKGNILKIPENLSFIEASLTEPLSCCINGQEYLNISMADTVVVIGAGPIGCLHAQLAKVSGATKVILIDLSEERLKLAQRIEVDTYINASREKPVKRVLEETNGKGAEVIITACPSPQAQEEALLMSKIRGRISFFGGLPHEHSHISFDSNIIHYKEISVYGAFASSHLQFKKALSLLASKKIEAKRFITHKFSLKEIEKGMNMVKEGKTLKAVIVME